MTEELSKVPGSYAHTMAGLAHAIELARRRQQMYAEIAEVQARYPDVMAVDDPWEGPPRFRLRCYSCGRTHPECNFYPIAGFVGPGTYGREMQLCNDCDQRKRRNCT